jgi:ATP-dependent Clp protease ATP-binding subunit ClpA
MTDKKKVLIKEKLAAEGIAYLEEQGFQVDVGTDWDAAELLARIPDKLVFARLTPEVQREIAALHLAGEVARLRTAGFDLEVSREALEFLLREGFHPHLGARPLQQTIERNLQDAVVRGLLAYGSGSGRIVVESGRSRLALMVN